MRNAPAAPQHPIRFFSEKPPPEDGSFGYVAGAGLFYRDKGKLFSVMGVEANSPFMLPPHAASHGVSGSDPVVIAESQVTNLTTDLAAKVPTSRLINTTSPLTGGGDLSADRTIAFSVQAANTMLAGPTSGGSVVPAFRLLVAADIPNIAESQVTNLTTDLAAKAPTSRLINTTAPLAGGGDLSADLTLTLGTVGVANGGTGITSYTIGDMLYASAVGVLSKRAAVALGSVLISQGVGVAPIWSATPTVTSIRASGLNKFQAVLYAGSLGQISQALTAIVVSASGGLSDPGPSSAFNERFGNAALGSLTTGGFNTAFGYNALASNTSPSRNTAFGCLAILSASGGSNTAVGMEAMRLCSIGAALCTAVGYDALYGVNGLENTGIGYLAGGGIGTGAYNTCLGSQADISPGTLNYCITLGYQAVAHADGEFAVGPRITLQTFYGWTASNTPRNRVDLQLLWVDNTDATRKGQGILSAWDWVTRREAIRWEADGVAARLGFFGVTAVVQPTVAGSRGGNAALASLLTALADLGLVVDGSSA